jgi:hypothetical protein
MTTRQRTIVTISLPPAMAEEYKRTARRKGETASGFFREIFTSYMRQKNLGDFRKLQRYGENKARELDLTEKEIADLVFRER